MNSLSELVKGPPKPEDPASPELEARVEKFISEKWLDMKGAFWVYHSWIWEALLFYAGNLWLKWNSDRRGYEIDTPADDFTPRPRINRFAPAIDAIASNFQIIPDIEAVPTPADDVDKMGIAEICNELSDFFIKDCALRSDFQTDEDKVGIAGQWLTLGGCFFTNVFAEDVPVGTRPVMAEQEMAGMMCRGCDTFVEASPEEAQASGGVCPHCGQPMEVSPVSRMMAQNDENGSPLMEPITEKRVRCVVESPLAGYPRPGAKSMKDTGYFILAERWGLDRIWSELGIEDAQADAEQPDGWNTTAENALNFFYLGYSNNSLNGKDGAMVIRLYIEPNKVKDFPEGLFAVYINGKCKKVEPWQFIEHPLTKVDFKALPTSIFPRSVAFDLCGVVREFLDYLSLISLHGKTNAACTVVVEDSTNMGEWTGRGDKLLKWVNRGPGSVAPFRLQGGNLDAGIYTMLDKLEDWLEKIAQTVAVFRGEAPVGVKAGVALDTLRIQADAMFAGPKKSYANGWKESVRKGVKLYQQEYTLEQLAAIVGENRLTELQAFKQCDLDSCVEWIPTELGAAKTQSEKKQEMIDLFDRGMLDVNDPAVREKAFVLFGDTGMLGTFNKDAGRARWENSNFKNGGVGLFQPEFDDNKVHLDVHLDAIKSMDFLNWPPEAQTALMQHALETKAQVAAEQQQIAAMQQPKAAVPPQPQPAGGVQQ